MPLVAGYHRPRSLTEALELLQSPERVPLAGGTVLNANRVPSSLEAVDLQALGLDGIEAAYSGRVTLGATATLDAAWRCELLPAQLRKLARAEMPSALRTLATVGGLVACGGSESLLLAALLAHDGRVSLADLEGGGKVSLAELLRAGLPAGTLITAVTVDIRGTAAVAATGRTPADAPIVAAYGRVVDGSMTLALSGVAGHPVLVDADDPTRDLHPEGDFRGSTEYRLHLARTLAARVIDKLSR